MTIDMYGERAADAMATIREFAKTEYYHWFARNYEGSLEQLIAMLDQAEEKGRLNENRRLESRLAELERENSSLRYELNAALSGGTVSVPGQQDKVLCANLGELLLTQKQRAQQRAQQQVSDLSAAIQELQPTTDTINFDQQKAMGYELGWMQCRDACAALAASQHKAGVQDIEAMVEKMRDALAEVLGEAMDCTRVWSAWSYGTMGPDDFSVVANDDDRLDEIARAAVAVLIPPTTEGDQSNG